MLPSRNPYHARSITSYGVTVQRTTIGNQVEFMPKYVALTPLRALPPVGR